MSSALTYLMIQPFPQTIMVCFRIYYLLGAKTGVFHVRDTVVMLMRVMLV